MFQVTNGQLEEVSGTADLSEILQNELLHYCTDFGVATSSRDVVKNRKIVTVNFLLAQKAFLANFEERFNLKKEKSKN